MKPYLFISIFALLSLGYRYSPIAPKPPNIIVILTDDQGYGDVGFNGCQDIPTPGIDRIATHGTVFTSGYVSFAVCGPSRAGLITGRYQDRFGFSRNPVLAPRDSTVGLPLSEQTMADLLKQAGYCTAAFGKWHLGAHPTLHPNRRGFDEFYGFLSGGHRYFPEELIPTIGPMLKSQNEGYKTRLMRNSAHVDETEYLTDAFSREASNFIRKNQGNPFFIYLAYNAPHAPLQATEKYLQRFEHIKDPRRKTYAAMVSAVDEGVNQLLNVLDELKLTENTIVFFLSDNGGPIPDNSSSNGVLRGKKGDFYEGGIRVPFAIQWPGKIPAGKKYAAPVISLDIFATAASLAGVKPRNKIDGVNLIPYLNRTKKGLPHQALFWRHSDLNVFAVRSGDDKLMIRQEVIQLFDLNQDIGEKNNLVGQQDKQLRALNKQLEAWKKQLIPPAFLGLNQDAEYSRTHPDRWQIKGEF